MDVFGALSPTVLSLVVANLAITAFDIYLDRRQLSHATRYRSYVLPDFEGMVSREDNERAADYEAARRRHSMICSSVRAALTLAWVFYGYRALYAAISGWFPPGDLLTNIYFVAFMGIGYLISLPDNIYRVFWIEERFGFNRTNVRTFVMDQVKKVAVGGVLLSAGCWLLTMIYNASGAGGGGGLWWLYAWGAMSVVVIAGTVVYPRFIMPLFNRFSPLTGELRQRIDALVGRCGFAASGVFVMDASKRSTHGNAFLGGFGRLKRIVLYNTLIDNHSSDEIEAILAHELGHYRLKHIWWNIAFAEVTLLVVLYLASVLFDRDAATKLFGLADWNPPTQLMLFVLTAPLANLIELVSNVMSRIYEHQADEFSAGIVGVEMMAATLTKLSKDNATMMTDDPLYAAVNYSHPSTAHRVAYLRRQKAGGSLLASV